MLFVGDIYVYVTELTMALRFWSDGLQLAVAEKEVSPHSAYARLDFPDGGPSIRLLGPAEPWPLERRPAHATRCGTHFDITTDDFDNLLVRLIEYGGQQVDEIESYEGLRAVTVADPDGNTFELLEIREDETASPDAN
jgi:catechol 2,3-dioxygenase-like lactoylglutathione lyase family enzyme